MSYETLLALREGVLFYIILITALCFREWGRAQVADWMGEYRPRQEGRLTLNPFVHMDLVGSVILPLMLIFIPIFMGSKVGLIPLFAWSKPIMIDLNDPHTRVRKELIFAGAGPCVNFFVTLLCAALGYFIAPVFPGFHLGDLFIFIIWVNAALVAINLLPLPPLDGSMLMKHIFKISEQRYEQWAQWSFLIFIVLINIPMFRMILQTLISFIALPAFYVLSLS